MKKDHDDSRFRRAIRRRRAADEAFDAVYSEAIKASSTRFWTPVAVAARAAELFMRHGARRILDVGSGPGKFCLVAARAHPDLHLTGVEHRAHLVQAAHLARARLRVENTRFVVGDLADLSWVEFDGLYLYNPFTENVCDEAEHFDESVELSLDRYMADVRRVRAALAAAPVGMIMVTYHGFGGPIPVSYELVHAERAHSDWLRVWAKKPGLDERHGFYVEDGDHVLIVNTAGGHTVSYRIPCDEAVKRGVV